MAKIIDAEQSSFSPGEKYPLLGVSFSNNNPWLRWGLPVATGLAGVLVFLFLIYAV